MNNKWHHIHLEETTSTNDWLTAQYNKGQPIKKLVVSTLHQTKGKGIGSNSWHSEKGKNLLMSIVSDNNLHPSDQFLLNMATTLAMTDTLEQYLPSEKINIKWPNDIWFDNKKIAGILISHMISSMQIDASIVGIGLNVNQLNFPSSLPNPISMHCYSGQLFNIDEILHSVLQNFCEREKILHANTGGTQLKTEFLSRLLYYGEWKEYTISDEKIVAKITDVNQYGQLILMDKNGAEIICNLKEIIFPLV
jgi:BirA family biotin operon repressor/biotin-[acetyl-CoA-carboxylase] ligase